MKFILLNINNTAKNEIRRIELDDKCYIKELSLSKDKLEEMNKEPKGLVQKVSYGIKDKKIEKIILKALDNYDKKWSYLLSKNLMLNKYLAHKLQNMLGLKFTTLSEMETNIFKYIEEYLNNNQTLKKHELKILLIAKENKNINFKLIEKLLKEHKTVNIYLDEKVSSFVTNKIKQINKLYGTMVEVVKKDKKALSEYNVIYFIDDIKQNSPRLRFNKNSLILDISDRTQDKFNSNIVFLNEHIKNNEALKENIESLCGMYNKLELATVIRKITSLT